MFPLNYKIFPSQLLEGYNKQHLSTIVTSQRIMERIERVAAKQSEWRSLPISDKIILLKNMLRRMSNISLDQFITDFGYQELKTIGLPSTTMEGLSQAHENVFLFVNIVQQALKLYLSAYETSIDKKKKYKLAVSTSISGQTTIQTCPVITSDKIGPMKDVIAHVWLEPGKEAESFQVDYFLKDSKETGCRIVLGAGNHTFLATIDVLNGLFHCNQVVYLKQHPLRGHHEVITNILFSELIDQGYFASEVDSGVERSQELLYASCVSCVHLTGGKATHDAIVWGCEMPREKPVLQATMTSELGCVSPWIVVEGNYSQRELEHQAKHLFVCLFSNAGANCNSPKVIVLPKNWSKSKEFQQMVEAECRHAVLPIAYYPGMKERWEKFRNVYPNAKEIDSDQRINERQLSAPRGGDQPVLLPWLLIEVDVDLSTPKGRADAIQEFAFRTEPFCPVVTFAFVDNLDTAVDLCNNILFGSLSMTMTVPPNEKQVEIEQAIADLKYGTIGINSWGGLGYFITGGAWGAFPGEELTNVESGIGQIGNLFFIPHVQKSVFRTSLIVAMFHLPLKEEDLKGSIAFYRGLTRFLLKPGLWSLLVVIAAIAFRVRLPFS